MTVPLGSEEAAGLPTVANSYLKTLPPLTRLLRAYYRTNLRGRTRVTLLLARYVKSLQAVPIQIDDWPPVYVDLRLLNAHFWFIGSPFAHSPIEPDEQMVMRRFVSEGDKVFDIGANFGVHTALLAQLAGPGGRVFAFEPNAELLPALALTVQGLGNTMLFPYALSDDDSQAAFFVPSDLAMGSLADWTSLEAMDALREKLSLGKAQTITVQQQRIDDLVAKRALPRPDFIKCDVEGAEWNVFHGGRDTLDRDDAPVILFEAGPESAGGFGRSISDAADFLGALPRPGYRFFEISGGGTLRGIRPADLKQQNQNVLAVPRGECARRPELLNQP
jgi:FkbM family methyltransferase